MKYHITHYYGAGLLYEKYKNIIENNKEMMKYLREEINPNYDMEFNTRKI